MTTTCGRGPAAISVSMATRACVSELSLISMFHAMTGSVVPPPVAGGGGGGGGSTETTPPPLATVMEFRLNPLVSANSVICCTPAPSVTLTDTVVQFCHPPVAGIDTGAQTLLAALKPTCMAPPPGDATRSWTVYVPALATFTV